MSVSGKKEFVHLIDFHVVTIYEILKFFDCLAIFKTRNRRWIGYYQWRNFFWHNVIICFTAINISLNIGPRFYWQLLVEMLEVLVFQIGTRDPDLESIDLVWKKMYLELKLNLTQRTHVLSASPIVKLEIGNWSGSCYRFFKDYSRSRASITNCNLCESKGLAHLYVTPYSIFRAQ